MQKYKIILYIENLYELILKNTHLLWMRHCDACALKVETCEIIDYAF